MSVATLRIIRYTITLLFGVISTCAFSGLLRTKKNIIMVFGIFTFLGLLQGCIGLCVGFEPILIFYPLHTHLVLILILMAGFHIKVLNALSYVLISYMCCQIPAWISSLFSSDHGKWVYAEYIVYILIAAITLYFIIHYVSQPLYELINSSMQMNLIFMIVPLTYYLFDYITTVWTQLLYTGNYSVSQFMPLIICISYLLFTVAYRNEQVKRMSAVWEKSILENELKEAENEIDNLKVLDQMTKMYRHDLRHHFSILLHMAEQGDIEKLTEYINENIENINSITPKKFCDNEILNLLLSHFEKEAQDIDANYHFSVEFPSEQPLSNTEICVLLSNIMENAICALKKIPKEQRIFELKVKVFHGNIILTADNTCKDEVIIIENLPFTNKSDHGYGTKCIMSIAKKHGGFSDFKYENNMFRLMVVIPLVQ